MSQVVEGNIPRREEGGSFVEREARRRRRLLRFYLLLLIIPIALAIVVLVFGRSDRTLVIDEIKSQAPSLVQREVGQQIRPTIQSEVKNQISPTLGQIDGKINQVAETSKVSLEETNKRLQEENEALKTELNNKINEVAQSRVSREELQKENENLKTEINNSRQADLRVINQRVEQIQQFQRGLEGKVNGLQQRFDKYSIDRNSRGVMESGKP